MFYIDWTTNETALVFLQCMHNGNDDDPPQLFPQWVTLPAEDMIVSYPLMAYKGMNPMDKEIVICNLATNEPQRVIDISPCRFVAFIHEGLEKDSDGNTHIQFLVFRMNSKGEPKLRVMRYSQFPFKWTSQTDDGKDKDTGEFLMKGEFSVMTGAIEAIPENNDDINALCREKIRCCQLLEGERVGGKAVLIVLQLVDRIYAVSMNKEKVWDSKVIHKMQKMLRFIMQRGPDQEIYYVEENRDSKCQQIVRITFPFDPEWEIMDTFHGEKIIALSLMIDGGVTSTEMQSHALHILNNKSVYTKYSIENKEAPLKTEL